MPLLILRYSHRVIVVQSEVNTKMRIATHRVNCKCPICRSARGERAKTRTKFTASVNPVVISGLREWARRNDLSIAEALEKAVKDLLEKDRNEKDAFIKMLEAAPEDDEPVTEEDRRCIEEGRREWAAGETIPIEEVMKKYGIQC